MVMPCLTHVQEVELNVVTVIARATTRTKRKEKKMIKRKKDG